MSKKEPDTFAKAWDEFATECNKLYWNMLEATGLKKLAISILNLISKNRR